MNKLLYVFYTGTVLFLSSFLFGQNSTTILAPRYFNPVLGPNPIPLPAPGSSAGYPFNGYDGRPAERVQNIQVDAQGNILFFIIDGAIFNRQGNFFAEMVYYDNPLIKADGLNEVAVVQVPEQCNEYYIITTSRKPNGPSDGTEIMVYTRIRLEYVSGVLSSNSGVYLNNGSGGFTFATQGAYSLNPNNSWVAPLSEYNAYNTVDNPNTSSIKLAVSQTDANGNRLLFVTGGDHLWKFNVTANGIGNGTQIINYINHFGTIGYAQNYKQERGEMELVRLTNGNYRIAYPFNSSKIGDTYRGILVADLNSSGVVISGTIRVHKYMNPSPSMFLTIQGLEFSPFGNKLYVTHSTNLAAYSNPIDQLDVSGSVIVSTPLNQTGMSDFKNSHIETNTNGELYMVNASRMAKITNPNNTWNNSYWVNNALSLGFNYHLSQFLTSPLASGLNNPCYVLQDQIDGENYTAQLTSNPACCIANSTYTRDFYTATANQTWSSTTVNPLSNSVTGTITIKNELRIPAGKTVTINNMTFKFAPGAKVIVEHGTNGNPGGRLILNHTTFTVDNSCEANKMWLGVEVWGNQNVAQTNVSHGKLTMTNNSRIEHAHVGVLLSQRVGNNIYVFNDARNCGIVQATNSTFYNNMRGAWFRKHISKIFLGTNNSLSFFNNCEFLWENALLEGAPREHIRMESVKGVRILGSDLKQLSPQLYTPATTGVGIRSYESVFYVNEYCPYTIPYGTPCPVLDPCNFDHLSHGVYTTSSNGENYLVNKSNFINCRYGIFTIGAKNERITSNAFQVAELPYQSAGVVVINSTGYKIEENNFEEFNNPLVTHGAGQSYGILVRNSGTAHNEIYKNTFLNLKIGGQSEAINGTWDQTIPNPSRIGLQWKCNTFKSDIYEADLGVSMDGLIDYNQGYTDPSSYFNASSKAARNSFSLFGENPLLFPAHDIKVAPNNLYHFHYVYIDNNQQKPDNYTTSNVTITPAQFSGGYITNSDNVCPSKASSKFSDYLFKFNSVLSDLEAINNTIASESPNSPNLENLHYSRTQLISEKQELFNEICSRYKLNEGLENVAFDYVQFLTDLNEPMAWSALLQYNIERGELNNDALRTSLTGIESSEYLELTTIQEALQPTESTQYALEQDPGTVAQLQQIINAATEFDAARAMCLLNLIEEDQEEAAFLPLGSSNHAPIQFDETEYFGVLTGVNMYPNPSEGIVFFASMHEEVNLTKIELYDLSGVKILEHEIRDVNSVKLDYNHISSGTYLVKISTSTGRIETKKLTIK